MGHVCVVCDVLYVLCCVVLSPIVLCYVVLSPVVLCCIEVYVCCIVLCCVVLCCVVLRCMVWCSVCVPSVRAGGVLFKTRTQYQRVLGNIFGGGLPNLPQKNRISHYIS